MSALADIFAAVRLQIDGPGFEAQAAAAGTRAGNTAGAKMSQSLNSKLKGALKGAFGAGAGALFGIATQQAAALDTATQKLIADTGLVGAAADQAKGQLAGLYRGNLQGFDQISAALAKVHTDLGLTGTAAGDTTGLFLKFSTATGQDAAEAVAQADDTLDAFNLTAADAGPLLDKLIVSHQKWGGSISESQAALMKMAPALTSFGLGLDDGIGLLNLFNAAGVDASKVPTALAKALGKVKSPAEFKALLNDIKNTKDPFEQAQKAITLFGAKAGPQLAQALRQGNLDDFIVTMDEARGATNKAADAVESGWGARFQLIMHNVGGALAEFGQNFGPLLMVGAQLGPKLASGIGSAIGGLAGMLLPKLVASGAAQGLAMGGATAASAVATEATGVAAGQAVVAAEAIPAAAAAGTSIGTAMGAAAALVIPALITAAFAVPVALVFNKITGDIAKQTEDLTKKTTRFAADASLAALRQARAGVAEQLAKSQQGFHPLEDFLGLSGTSQIQQQLDLIDAALAKRDTGLVGNFGRTPTTTAPAQSGLGNAALAAAALTSTATTMTAIQIGLHKDFASAIEALRAASTPAAIAAAVARLTKDVRGGVGNAKQTAALVADLTARRDAALATGDKHLADTLSAEIRKISPLVAGRAHQAALLAQGAKIVASSESAKQKIADLKVIENELKAVHRTTAAAAIQKQIDTIAAINATTAAVGNLKPGQTVVVNSQTGFVTGSTPLPKPKPKADRSADSRSEKPHGSGLLGLTAGATSLGVAGEAGGEAVAIIKNPKPLSAAAALKAKLDRVFVTNWPPELKQTSTSTAQTAVNTSATVKETIKQTPHQKLLAAALKAIDERARAVGHHPTAALDKATFDRDVKRGITMDRILHAPIVGRLPRPMRVADSPAVDPRQSAGGLIGGHTYNVNVQGLLRARDPFEVATQLRRLASFGVLTPRTAPA